MSLAEQLITRGWTKGETINDEGEVCLHGALMGEAGCLDKGYGAMSNLQDTEFRAGSKVLMALTTEASPHGIADYVWYNDQEDTTYDDVLRLAKQFDEVVDWMKEMNGSPSTR